MLASSDPNLQVTDTGETIVVRVLPLRPLDGVSG